MKNIGIIILIVLLTYGFIKSWYEFAKAMQKIVDKKK